MTRVIVIDDSKVIRNAARKMLGSVRWLIVDEIHSVASSKRGSHLALSLERLCELTRNEPQRIGILRTVDWRCHVSAISGKRLTVVVRLMSVPSRW